MDKSVGLIRFELEGNYVQGVRFALDDARLAATLKNLNVTAKLYAGRSEGRVVDIVRQLTRLRVDILLMWVSEDSVGLAQQLSFGLKKIKPKTKIIWWGAETSIYTCVDGYDEAFDAIDAVSAQHVIPALKDNAILNLGEEIPQALSSPFLSNVISSVDEAIRLGFTAKQALQTLEAELVWLKSLLLGQKCLFNIDASQCNEQEFSDLLTLLKKQNYVHSIALNVTPKLVNSVSPALIKDCSIGQVQLVGEKSDINPKLMKYMLEKNVNVISIGGDSYDLEQALRYSGGGIFSLHTGGYFDANQLAALYHIEFRRDVAKKHRIEAYEWAGENLSIRCAAIENNISGSSNKTLLKKDIAWPQHTYAINLENDEKGQVIADNNQNTIRHIEYHGYADKSTIVKKKDTIMMLSIKSDADVNALVTDLNHFHSTGSLTLTHPDFPISYENTCRWTRFGSCKLSLVRRVQIDDAGMISTCRDTASIGTTANSYDELVANVKRNQQILEVERSCLSCSVRDECSQCSQLPSSWGGQYCEIRKSLPKTNLFFELQSLPLAIYKLLSKNDSWLEFVVSTDGLPNIMYSGKCNSSRTGNRPILFKFNNQFYVYRMETRKVISLSPALASIFEGWWNGATDQEIIEFLATHFDVKQKTASESFLQGFSLLEQHEVING